MKKSTIWLLAVVMAFAFAGLLYLQINYVDIILKTRRSRFTTRKFRHMKYMMQKETSKLCYIRISSRVKESNLELG